MYSFLPLTSQNLDQGQRDAQSRILNCDFHYSQKRASLERRKNDLVMQFDLLRQRKQGGLRRHRDPHAADECNPTPFLPGDAVNSQGHCHKSTEPVMYPDSPTIGSSQGKWRQNRDILCGTTPSDTKLMEQYLPATTYVPTATATRAVRPVTDRRDIMKLESNFLQTRFAHPITGRDARQGLWGTDSSMDYLDPVQRKKPKFEDRQISLKSSPRGRKSLEQDISDERSETAFQNLGHGYSGKRRTNNMSGAGHQEYLRKDNVTVPSSSTQDSEARVSVLALKTANKKSNSNRIHRSGSCYPLPVHPKPTAELSWPPADGVSKTVTSMIGGSKPTPNDFLGLNQLAELQSPHLPSKAAVKGYTSRPRLRLDTTFLSNELEEAEWSDNDSIKAAAGSTVVDEVNANELLAKTDCLHMPRSGPPTTHESILWSSEISKIDDVSKYSEFSSNETPLDTTPPRLTNSREPQPQLDTNIKKEIKSKIEEDLETLALTSEEQNSPSPNIEDQLDGTSWERVDVKGIEQDDAFFHQVVNPQKVGWGETARRTAWGWIR